MKYKIFVSANQRELKAERRAIKDYILGDALLSEYFDIFLFEDAPARGKSAETAYLGEVRKSDIYVGILGEKYGGFSRLPDTNGNFRWTKRHLLKMFLRI